MPMINKKELTSDIVIIGAGVAGCIAALALCDSYQVTLIDKSVLPEERIGECLAPAAKRILQQLNLLTEFEALIDTNITQAIHLHNLGMQVSWGKEKPHITDNLSNPDGFGWRLNRKEFELFLRNKAQQRGVECIWPARLRGSQYNDNAWHILLEHTNSDEPKEITICSQFVIDATGRQAHFAKKYTDRQQSDRLISCWATLANNSENQLGSICATVNGWWYSAPLPNQRRVLAFQTDSDLFSKGLNRDTALFSQLAQQHAPLAALLEGNQHTLDLHGITSANSTRLDTFVGQQWAALGDAATSFDPLSSQGIFNAMASAMQLASLIKKSEVIETLDNDIHQYFIKTYQQQIEQIWDSYLHHKHYFYNQEQRWSSHPFWQRRHQQTPSLNWG
ncbi:dehydrogenase [Pseudoalteromonas porphyrae]|uniref:tryptophan 7-halogenase n=1 Tax=Pseudoalteromonas TaxID=53246 RepID=UPI0006BB06D7|nr:MULTISPECIES: tryptophan 7-halogenase [Pseudoalteromonas]KPH93301.1 dehydrogenase [Pseudoalteromonas porphyrae]